MADPRMHEATEQPEEGATLTHPGTIAECDDCVVEVPSDPIAPNLAEVPTFVAAQLPDEDPRNIWLDAYNMVATLGGSIWRAEAAGWKAVETAGYAPDDLPTYIKVKEAVQVFAEADSKGGIFHVVLIREGRSANRRRYSAEVLRESARLFEGTKAYADHPTKAEAVDRPGRSVKEIVGWYEQVRFEESTQALVADFHVLQSASWLRDLLVEMVTGQGPQLVGLSINAEGRSRAIRDGDEVLMDVTEITKVSSVDVVTEPAAGGAVVKLVASVEEDAMDADLATLLKDATPEQLKELAPELYEQVASSGGGDDPPAKDDPPPKDPDPKLDPKPVTESKDDPEPDPKSDDDPKDESKDEPPEVVTEAKKILEEIQRERAQALISRKLEEAKFPQPLTESVKADLTEALERRILTEEDVDTRIKSARELWGSISTHAGNGKVTGVPSSLREGGDQAEGDRLVKAIDGMFVNEDVDEVPRFNSFKEAYYRWTGKDPFGTDPFTMFRESMAGYDSASAPRSGDKLLESMTTSSWGEVFADRLFRRMLAEYRLQGLEDPMKIVSGRENISDFRTQRRIRWGGYGLLSEVAEADTYPELTSPGDEEATYAITKKGGLEDITFEMMVNDDLRNIRRIPTKLARAAKQTLYRFVFDFLADNSAIYDAVALIDSSTHANHQTAALSDATLAIAWQQMRSQTAFGNSTEPLGSRPKYLVVPNELEQLAWQLVNSAVTILSSAFNATEPNFFQSKMEVIVVDYWTDIDNWFMVADPNDVPTIELGFLNGQEDPELFVQDQPNVGSVMTADKITYKVRHIYNGAVMDWRGFQGSIVTA